MFTSRLQANQFYAEAITDARNAGGDVIYELLHELSLRDLWFLLTVVLGRFDMNNDKLINPDWLFSRCMEVQYNPDENLDLWAREHYKALATDTPVLLYSGGWKKHGDLSSGDVIFSPEGKPVKVIASTGEQIGAECFAVSGVVAAGEHLWPEQVRCRLRIKNTEKRRVAYKTIKTATIDLGEGARLPNIAPVELRESKQEIDAYVLGFWLGDGHSNDSRITTGDREVWELLKWPRIKKTSVEITRTLVGLRPKLREINVLGNKHIPDQYLYGGVKQRLELLQGLMDSDGHINTRGTATFVNTNKNLVDGVYFLAASLGMRPHKRCYDTFWQVSFQAYKMQAPVKLSRKYERCKEGVPNMRRYQALPVKSVPVNCIQVEGGLYLAGKELLPTCNSTIITYALTIQDILKDPEQTFGIFSVQRELAQDFLKQIKQELESNEELKRAHPDVLYKKPERESPQWGLQSGIRVKRKGNYREETVEAWGLFSLPTGKHFSVLVFDDVVTERSVTNFEQLTKAFDQLRLAFSLGSHGGKRRFIGTRYHDADAWGQALKNKIAKQRLYPATDNGNPEGNPVFLKKEALEKKASDMGPYIFACQMLQNPKADEAQGFKTEWLRYWTPKPEFWMNMNIYLLVDPSSGKKIKETGLDYTAMWVIGAAADKRLYVIDGTRERLNPQERINKVFAFVRKYHPIKVGYEQYGMQADIAAIEKEMELLNFHFEIEELGGSMPKVDRIRRLIPDFYKNNIYLPGVLTIKDRNGAIRDIVKEFVAEEYEAFPYGIHDDSFDCLARVKDAKMEIQYPDTDEHMKLVGGVPNIPAVKVNPVVHEYDPFDPEGKEGKEGHGAYLSPGLTDYRSVHSYDPFR